MTDSQSTELHATNASRVEIPFIRVEALTGIDRGRLATSLRGRVVVGTAEDATLRLREPTVSRYHVELEVTEAGVLVRDLGSTNGTVFAGAQVREIVVRGDVELSLGRARIRVVLAPEREARDLSAEGAFGGLVGASLVMREVYAAVELAAATTSPVLITGESGTGKELAARALHDAGARAQKPMEVLDCGALPTTLIEAELFGHERGAFTGASGEYVGAFERADGGTLFLDEIGEMPLDLQPKLLRALGEREVRRVGGTRARKVDVRVVAATNRDLRREVNAGRFRADLYYRLAVIQVRMPALRERMDDLPRLATALVSVIREDRGITRDLVVDDALLDEMRRHDWPGNVRELRNWLERQLVLGTLSSAARSGDVAAAPLPGVEALAMLPLRDAKAQLVERFERQYVTALLERCGGNLTVAARCAGVDRVTLFRTLRRYGIRREGEGEGEATG